MRVVILGGYGVFGGRLARLLLRDGHEVWIAGRNHERAQRFAIEHGGQPLMVDLRGDLAPILGAAPNLLVDVAWPFQAYGDDPYRVAQFCVPPSNLAAYECVLRGDALPVGDPAAVAEAHTLYERAVELDSGYARARAMLAYQLSICWLNDLDAPDNLLDRALEIARGAVALDPCCSIGHGILDWAHSIRKSFDIAERHKQRALELVPNSVYEIACMGVLHTFLGDADGAFAFYSRARALDPFYEPAWFWRMQGMAHFLAGRYDEAVACLERSPTMPLWVFVYLAAAHTLAERPALAADHANRVLARESGFTVSRFIAKEPLKREEHRARLHAGLRRAGLPA